MESATIAQIMPRQAPFTDVVIYEYGVLVDKSCVEAAGQQIIKARQLYNNLVALMRDTVQALQAFVLEQAGEEARQLNSEIEALNEQFAAAKAANDEAALKVVAQERRLKWRDLGEKLRDVRKAHKEEIQQNFLAKIGKNSSRDTYRIRSDAVAAGLGWATANAVLDAALNAWKKSFMLGRAPRFSVGAEKDQDTLTLQFTAKGGVPVATLLEGSHGELSIKPTQGCGPRKYGEFAFRLGAASVGVYASGTWQYHRPLPADANVGLARLVRRRIGKDYRWALQLMVKRPSVPEKHPAGRKPLVSVHFGWAADLGGRRVAGIAESGDPESGRVLQLPPEIEGRLAWSANLQSQRDQARDAVVPQVKAMELGVELPEAVAEELAVIRRLPVQHVAISRLHRLCHRLREQASLPDWLEAWRKEDRYRWQSATHTARRARYGRRDFYRKTALDLARHYDAIAIEPLDLKAAAKKVDEVTGEKTEFAKKARAGRVVAAIFELESAIRWAAAKEGAAVIDVTGDTVNICGICGGLTEALPDSSQVIQCQACGAALDRKKNGAAMAWQRVAEQREDLVSRYWIERRAAQEEAQADKAGKLAKMTEGRRKARTAIKVQALEDSRT